MLFKRWLINCEFRPTLQVCRSLQSESRLHLQGELVHLPGQHWENHRCQLWRKRKWLPRRQVNACNLQKSGNLWGGRSDNSCPVRKATEQFREVSASPAQTNSFTVSVSQESLIKLVFDLFLCLKFSHVSTQKHTQEVTWAPLIDDDDHKAFVQFTSRLLSFFFVF